MILSVRHFLENMKHIKKLRACKNLLKNERHGNDWKRVMECVNDSIKCSKNIRNYETY